MEKIPIEVREYLSSDADYYRATLLERFPDLEETLAAPDTREAILQWLSSDEANEEVFADFVFGCLEFLRVGVHEDEVPIIRPFLLSQNYFIRLRAYEALLTLYFPDNNKAAMFMLLHGMLSDNEDILRSQAVRYIERVNATDELRSFLERWYKTAPNRGWDNTESYELVERLLNE